MRNRLRRLQVAPLLRVQRPELPEGLLVHVLRAGHALIIVAHQRKWVALLLVLRQIGLLPDLSSALVSEKGAHVGLDSLVGVALLLRVHGVSQTCLCTAT